MVRNACFTSESVTEGHPDKICDQIADAVLDEILTYEPDAHVACEVSAANGIVLVMGETSALKKPDYGEIVRKVIEGIGYGQPESGFDLSHCATMVVMNSQSPDIRMGVDSSREYQMGNAEALDLAGAGDQGMMVGFACDETPELMPLPISLAHKLTQRLAKVRKNGCLPWLLPDGKSQVTVRYDKAGEPLCCATIVVSAQHRADVPGEELERAVRREVIEAVIPPEMSTDQTKIWINPTGRFVLGGPAADSGLTGRKIMVDTYGGYVSHGGGAFSGKDPSKVDRTGAYMARYIAKNIVASGLARHCMIQLAYAIGVAQPVSVYLDTDGTGILPDEVLSVIVRTCFDMRPAAMIEKFGLKQPVYSQVSCYGHFGRGELNLPWEQTDMAFLLSAFRGIRY